MHFVRTFIIEVDWVSVELVLMNICYWSEMICISHQHHVLTIYHPMIVHDIKGEANVGLTQSLITPQSFIYLHVQPTPLRHIIDTVDENTPYNFVLVGCDAAFLYPLGRYLIVIDLDATLNLYPP